jgi:uncharacterized protein (TIGR02246 family)
MRILASRALGLVAVLGIAACAPAPAPATATGTSDDEVAIRGLASRYAEAWNKGDIPTLATMVTDDYEAVTPDGTVIKGKAASEESEKKALAQRAGLSLVLAVNTSFVNFGSANSAAAGGTWTLAGLPPGAGAEKGAWSVFVKKAADGQWRMASGLVADYVPPPAPPVPADKAKGK